MKIKTVLYSCLLLIPMMVHTQFEPNYDENKVPQFTLPDALVTFDGKKIRRPAQWRKKRRPEILDFFERKVYGQVPGSLDNVSFTLLESDRNALEGKAHRKQVEVLLTKNGKSLSFTILLYTPKGMQNAPVFLGYNFYGNHTITNDTLVKVPKAWSLNNEGFGVMDHTPTAKSRGVRTNRWDLEKILKGGFGLATIFYGEVDPDKNDLSDGLHALFYEEEQERPNPEEWGSIAAWAFGLSRALDYLETDCEVNGTKVIAFGHSRLGKASLWAGVTDERFAAVVSNNSGCGGATLSKRKFGETIGRINTHFPHWFATNFKEYNDKEMDLPVDQHQLLALIAPRPLYVASAQEDLWADPRGEFLSAHHASTVYHLYKQKGVETIEMPQPNIPLANPLSYHLRTGIHDVTAFDWEQYILWAQTYVAP